MATPNGDLAKLRQACQDIRANVNYTKPQINAVLSAAEDWLTANWASLRTAMEAAAPGVFTNAEKQAIAARWIVNKATRGL